MNDEYENGRREMAAEIFLILAAGAGTSGLDHIVRQHVRHVWDPETYPYAPLPRGIATRIKDYEYDLMEALKRERDERQAAEEAPAKRAEEIAKARAAYPLADTNAADTNVEVPPAVSSPVPIEPEAPANPENAALEGADADDPTEVA